MKNKKMILFTILILSILTLVILYEPIWAQSKTKKAELKIGMTGPLSGSGISYGYCVLGGLELAMDDINKGGGLKVGDTVYTLKAIPYDTKFLADPGVTAAKRLIYEDKVKVIFGEIGSAPGLAIQAITEPNKIVFFPDTYTELMLGADKPFTFRWCSTWWEFSSTMFNYYRKRFPQAKRVGLIYRDDDSGRSCLRCMQKFAPDKGFEIVPFALEPGTIDLTPLVTKLLSANIDLFDVNGNPPGEVAQMINIARGMGWEKPIMRTGGSIVSEILRLCGKNGDGFIYHEDADTSSPKIKILMDKFKAKGYPTQFNNMLVPAYDGAGLLFKAIQKAGSVEDTTAIKNAMESIKSYEGVQGKVTWGGMGTYGINHQLMNVALIGEIQNGKPTIVDKWEFK